jgi:predicted phosphohydrolase
MICNHKLRDYWESNGITPPQEVIVCAAVIIHDKYNDRDYLLAGARHWDSVMHQQAVAIDQRPHFWFKERQGFINQFGEFRTREEAIKIVLENGQPFNEERNGGRIRLFSEGLY